MRRRLTNILAATAVAATLTGGIATSAQAMPLPVTSAAGIAGAAPTDQVRWWGGWRGGWGGWGWRGGGWGRGVGGAIAAGAIAGGLLGLAGASSYYGYGYPYYGYGYSYPYYSYGYSYPAYYSYPSYYGYYGGYGGYWASGKQPIARRVHRARHVRPVR